MLILICISLLGYFPVFQVLRFRARQEIKFLIKSGIPDQDLRKFEFNSDEQIEWIKEGKEFKYGNQLFDVVRQEEKPGAIVYWCLNDVQETKLFAQLNALAKRNLEDEHTPLGNAYCLLMNLLRHLCQPDQAVEILFVSGNHIHAFQYSFVINSSETRPESPPPQNS
ncbi:MAG: hypothetical protein JNM00_01695 [Flavobacteriales bacterium]|nr:hypothetical protein [Flavobacteriales bacterium]